MYAIVCIAWIVCIVWIVVIGSADTQSEFLVTRVFALMQGDLCYYFQSYSERKCRSKQRCRLTNIGIPIIKIRRSHYLLVVTMEIPIAERMVFILRQGPGSVAKESRKTTNCFDVQYPNTSGSCNKNLSLKNSNNLNMYIAPHSSFQFSFHCSESRDLHGVWN